jgi:ubiquinone/menaquinone biosynthesis C-methylase UbiE
MASKSIAFDNAASYYDETRGYPPGEEKIIAANIARAGQLSASSRVLEVGIGTGRVALPLAQHVRAIFGVDLSRAMMDRLRIKQTDERIFLAEGDVTKLPLAGGSFDAVVAAHVFHLIPNWKDGLHEVERVLRPGAPIIILWHEGDSDSRMDLITKAWYAAVPQESENRPGIKWAEYGTFPLQQAWKPFGERLTHTYKTTETPQSYIDKRRRRVWSGMWKLTDEQVEKGIAAMQAVIEAHFTSPDELIETSNTHHVQAYVTPE